MSLLNWNFLSFKPKLLPILIPLGNQAQIESKREFTKYGHDDHIWNRQRQRQVAVTCNRKGATP